MTQKELRNKIREYVYIIEDQDAIMQLINQHVKEVIGTDTTNKVINAILAEQRKRAGL